MVKKFHPIYVLEGLVNQATIKSKLPNKFFVYANKEGVKVYYVLDEHPHCWSLAWLKLERDGQVLINEYIDERLEMADPRIVSHIAHLLRHSYKQMTRTLRTVGPMVSPTEKLDIDMSVYTSCAECAARRLRELSHVE